MKRTHIIALVFVAVLVASLTVMLGKGFSRYESFDSSYAKKGKEFTVVGYLNKEKGIEYKPEINPNQFSMYVIDEQKVERQVVVNKAKPRDIKYTSSSWRRRSRIFLARHPTCERCGAPSEIAHHIIRRRDGGSDDEENLEALCRSCHEAEHNKHGERWGKHER